MSGHSKWSTIKRQKGVRDATRGAVFTKIGNTIAVAARAGSDPETNFALRLAIEKAKAANMPMANIQRAIDRQKNKNETQLQDVLYEGYGPGGVAIIVECTTDNINRTYPDVRLAFSRHGGSLVEKGSVVFQFEHRGMIRVKQQDETVLELAIEVGAEDVIDDGDSTIVYCDPKSLNIVRQSFSNKNFDILDAELTYVPKDLVKINDLDIAGKVMRLMEALEDIDDVSNTFVNFDIEEDILERIG